jgi:hypothetical protein
MESNEHQNERLDLLWGVKAIAAYLGLNERQTHYQIENDVIPVKRQGRLIVASKSALRKHFSAGDVSTTPAPNGTPAEATTTP